jgi:hypothetical protein
MRKTLAILLTIMLVSSGLMLLAPAHHTAPIKAHILDATPDHYWIGTTTDTSVAANWQPAAVPATGDNIYFSALSVGNCASGLTGSYGSFNLLANFTRTVTQAASFSVTSYTQAAGTYTPSASYILTDAGSFTKSGGSVGANLNLIMAGTGNTFSLGGGAFYTLTIQGDTTLSGGTVWTASAGGSVTINSGKTLTLNSQLVILNPAALSNSGIMAGASAFTFQLQASDLTGSLGTVNCPLNIQATAAATANRVLTLSVSQVYGSTLTINSLHASNTMTLDLSASNYALSATSITIGTRGILNGRGSTITCSGSFDSSASSDTAASLSSAKLYLTGTTKTLKQSSVERFGSIMLSGSYTMQSNVYCANYWNNGTMTKAGYTLYVSNNQAPVFTAYDSSKWIDWFSPYSYTFTATDREAETLTFAKTSSLSGLTIGSSSGIISKSAPITNGTWDIHVSVSDGNHTAWKNYTIDIRYTPTFTDRYYWSNSTFRNWFNATYPNWFNATYDLNSTQLTNETNRTINYVEIGLMFTIVIGFLVVGIIIAFTRRKKHGET